MIESDISPLQYAEENNRSKAGSEDMAVKALHLFKAFAEEKLPAEGGYIISSSFQETSAYSK